MERIIVARNYISKTNEEYSTRMKKVDILKLLSNVKEAFPNVYK